MNAADISISTIKSALQLDTPAAKRYKEDLDFAAHIQEMRKDSGTDDYGVKNLIVPSAGLFQEMTGVSYEDAVSIVHGVIGSNVDLRDWQKIMTSDDPLATARAETAAMYNSGADYVGTGVTPDYLRKDETVAQSGNFALQQVTSADGQKSYASLLLVDSQGKVVRNAGHTEAQIAKATWLFGFDPSQLQALVEPAKKISSGLAESISAIVQSSSNQTQTTSSAAQASSTSTASQTSAGSTSVQNTSSASTQSGQSATPMSDLILQLLSQVSSQTTSSTTQASSTSTASQTSAGSSSVQNTTGAGNQSGQSATPMADFILQLLSQVSSLQKSL